MKKKFPSTDLNKEKKFFFDSVPGARENFSVSSKPGDGNFFHHNSGSICPTEKYNHSLSLLFNFMNNKWLYFSVGCVELEIWKKKFLSADLNKEKKIIIRYSPNIFVWRWQFLSWWRCDVIISFENWSWERLKLLSRLLITRITARHPRWTLCAWISIKTINIKIFINFLYFNQCFYERKIENRNTF